MDFSLNGYKMVTKWEVLSKVKASNYRVKVLSALSQNKLTPKEIQKETQIKFTHVSRALNELKELDLVKCLTPEERKYRIYTITDKGKKINLLL